MNITKIPNKCNDTNPSVDFKIQLKTMNDAAKSCREQSKTPVSVTSFVNSTSLKTQYVTHHTLLIRFTGLINVIEITGLFSTATNFSLKKALLHPETVQTEGPPMIIPFIHWSPLVQQNLAPRCQISRGDCHMYIFIERERERSSTTKRMLRKRSWALHKLKARSRLEQISRRWSFRTLLTIPSERGRFFATTRRPEHGRGLAAIRLPSIASAQLTSLMGSCKVKQWASSGGGAEPQGSPQLQLGGL